MLAKPDPRLAGGRRRRSATIARAGRARILALAGRLRRCATTCWRSWRRPRGAACSRRPATAEPPARASARRAAWLAIAVRRRRAAAELAPAAEIERSLAVGAGLRRAGPAVGARAHVAQRSTRRSSRGSATAAWPTASGRRFARLAAQMERVAFGPPPVNAAKLLALVDAGRVDLAHVAGGRLATAAASRRSAAPRGERAVDVVVDAVLPPPGRRARDGGLLGAARSRDGHARVAGGRRGLDVDAGRRLHRRATAAARAGPVGDRPRRPRTAVIGNDTLSRTLHPHADRWAARVGRACGRAPTPVARAPAPAP